MNIMVFLNWDLLDLEMRDSYEKPHSDYASFHFLRLCFRVLQFLSHSTEAATASVLQKKMCLKISWLSQEKNCVGVSFNKVTAATFLKKDSNTVFCSEIWEIFKKTYFEEHLQTNASDSIVVSKSMYTWCMLFHQDLRCAWCMLI